MTLKRDQPMVSQGTVVEKGKVGKYLAFRMLHLTLVNTRKPQRYPKLSTSPFTFQLE